MALKKSIFGIYHPGHKVALLCVDMVAFSGAFLLASQYRLKTNPDFYSVEFLGITIIALTSLFVGGAYTSRRIHKKPKLPLNTFFVVLASTPPTLLFIYILGPEHFTALLGRGVYPFALVGFGVWAVINRHALNYLFRDANAQQQILLLGETGISDRLLLMLKAQKKEITLTNSDRVNSHHQEKLSFDAVIIGTDYQPDAEEQKTLLNYRLAGMPIYSLSDFFEDFFYIVPVQEINNDWFIRSQGFAMLHSSISVRIKRLFDIIGAFTLAIISLPITLLTVLCIKITSKGPALFTQTRVGMNGKKFTIYKFRTMVLNAENNGAQWASKNDDRIIPLGHFFRKTRIDELPQIWNIIRGDMSIVGPRPERPEFTQKLSQQIPYYDLRHVIKPGLSGWAQVSYPYGASTEDALKKLQYDLYYVKNYSLLLDLNIILRTVLVTLKRGGR